MISPTDPERPRTRQLPRPFRPRHNSRAQLADWRRMDQALHHSYAYPHPAGVLIRIETHISVVYLAGRYAYKIGKPVNLGFADFTTREARFECYCEALRLNRPLAPSLYVDVVTIRRYGRTFKVGTAGKPFDHALKIRRFDERNTLSALLARHELRSIDIDRIAARLASFHIHASSHAPSATLGSAEQVREQLESVLTTLAGRVPGCVSQATEKWCQEEIARCRAHIDQRRRDGFVRECHGDLHLDNMVRNGNDVVFFDCVDFNDALRWIDITADVAFVVMDLLAHERGDLATRFLNRWVTLTGDFAGLAALRLYVVYRALVRALVAALKRRGNPLDGGDDLASRNYLRLADRMIAPPRTFLILCHGFSGSGKSVASEALAWHIGAIRVSSDIERKRPRKPSVTTDAPSLDATSYTPESIDANYARLRTTTAHLLESGFPVIVDASFLKRTHRSSFIQLATAQAVPIFIVDFEAGLDILSERLRSRAMQPGNASDADVSVLPVQLKEAEDLTGDELAFTIKINTGVSPECFDDRVFWRRLIDRLGAHRGWLSA